MSASRISATTAVALLLAIGAVSCGDDDAAHETVATTTTVPTVTAAPTTTNPTTTTASPTTTTAPKVAEIAEGTPEAEVAAAYRTVFDSSIAFADKAMHLEDATALEATVIAYGEGGKSFGGFKLEPTAVTISGDRAELSYDVYFGTTLQYPDQEGGAVLVDGVWTIERSEFCSFMASARTPCPA